MEARLRLETELGDSALIEAWRARRDAKAKALFVRRLAGAARSARSMADAEPPPAPAWLPSQPSTLG